MRPRNDGVRINNGDILILFEIFNMIQHDVTINSGLSIAINWFIEEIQRLQVPPHAMRLATAGHGKGRAAKGAKGWTEGCSFSRSSRRLSTCYPNGARSAGKLLGPLGL